MQQVLQVSTDVYLELAVIEHLCEIMGCKQNVLEVLAFLKICGMSLNNLDMSVLCQVYVQAPTTDVIEIN